MAFNNVLRWCDGRGWLVFSGAPGSDVVRAAALGRVSADGGLVVVCMGAADWCEQVLDDLKDLGAPAGYLVDVLSEADDVIRDRLSEAGMIVVTGADDAWAVRSALMGAAAAGILAAFANGALILLEGTAAAAAGAWLPTDEGEPLAGLSWLHAALVIPGTASVSELPPVRSALRRHPNSIAIGIGGQSALVLGPDGEVEIWGERQISIVLGSDYHR
jgi:hypothetical protein